MLGTTSGFSFPLFLFVLGELLAEELSKKDAAAVQSPDYADGRHLRGHVS
jgi:hypothetical protein